MSEIPQENNLLKKQKQDLQIFGIGRHNHYYPDKSVLLLIETSFMNAHRRISKRVSDTISNVTRLTQIHLRNK